MAGHRVVCMDLEELELRDMAKDALRCRQRAAAAPLPELRHGVRGVLHGPGVQRLRGEGGGGRMKRKPIYAECYALLWRSLNKHDGLTEFIVREYCVPKRRADARSLASAPDG